jgi:addiction module HigA family antidote
MPMKNPPHPGDFIRTEIIEPAGLSVTAAAAALNVSRPALSSLLNSKADLSGDMALRIEKAFGVKMDTLMRMQASYDIAQTRKREKQIHVKRVSQLVHAQGEPFPSSVLLLGQTARPVVPPRRPTGLYASTTCAVHAASRISSNLKGGTQQFG